MACKYTKNILAAHPAATFFFASGGIWHIFRSAVGRKNTRMDKTKVVIYSTRRTLGDMISDMISDSDSLVVTCSTPEQTVTACLRLAPDIVILLAVAPFIDGSEFIGRIRRRGTRRPAVYVVSWHQAEHIVLSLLEAGVDQYLTFPVSMGRLYGKVRDIGGNIGTV